MLRQQDPPPLFPELDASESTFDFSNLDDPIPILTNETMRDENHQQYQQTQDNASHIGIMDNLTKPTPIHGGDTFAESVEFSSYPHHAEFHTDFQAHTSPLEHPPLEDFEWDERHMSHIPQYSHDVSAPRSGDEDNEEEVIDGMASLTVDEKEGGYLGVASGAALLRIIDPTPKQRTRQGNLRLRTERFSSGSSTMPAPLYEQPNPNKHILDSMIDAYFGVYHVSYPIVHEPTFRAQYSEVIPRPNGDCWLILAYTIAAIGVFTTAKTLDNTDLPLFAHAKSMFSINLLETGNLTLVQALTLISNYQQKRNMPNSGYNYLGLAQRMAMGLGLHKEFPGWNISPLKMEIRRRVWWSLCVFDVGATITFSRPMTWPGEGIEVALPLNVSDRVGNIFRDQMETFLT